MFAFTCMLHSEYTTSCFRAKCMAQCNKQARQTFHCLVLNSHFIQPSECKYVFFLFVCLSDCKYLLFRCISDTLAGDFLFAQLIYRGKVELCHPHYDFHGKESKLLFRGRQIIPMFCRQNRENLVLLNDEYFNVP